jgi:hypothetical protein
MHASCTTGVGEFANRRSGVKIFDAEFLLRNHNLFSSKTCEQPEDMTRNIEITAYAGGTKSAFNLL